MYGIDGRVVEYRARVGLHAFHRKLCCQAHRFLPVWVNDRAGAHTSQPPYGFQMHPAHESGSDYSGVPGFHNLSSFQL